ncbi:unnamed protein product [Didymodactylos carnosus]|uniref:Kinesin light chain n=2 Tax=Didymodactylos carnosus TaxID=1234261 RepID=A0A8S2ESW2_9BILA|nr:unnamed protein product [Didymodactylos carnosus]CAF4103517.1 unnamed protein product [Didymodactylos carnosus]
MGNRHGRRQRQEPQAGLVDLAEKTVSPLPLIWLDVSLDSIPSETLTVQEEFQLTFTVTLFDDELDCEGFIRDLPLTKKITKVKRVQLDQLLRRVKAFQARWYRNVTESLSINYFKQDKNTSEDRSSTDINGSFLFSQLLINTLLHMNSLSTDMNELVDVCTREYAGNASQLKQVELFYNNYTPDECLRWYTKQTFLYILLNKSLRVQNIELLFLYRFFIRDTQRELAKNQCKSPVKVYRGQMMSLRELDRLRKSIGDIISMNSFLSTSLDRQLAEFYVEGAAIGSHGELDSVPVLFEIDAHPSVASTEKPFANISQFSEFAEEEQEVLFMLGSVYRLNGIREENRMYVVSMNLCNIGEHESNRLLDVMKHDYNIRTSNSLRTYACVLVGMGKLDIAEMFLRRVLRELSLLSVSTGQQEQTIEHASCAFSLGQIAWYKGQHDSALDHFRRAHQTFITIPSPTTAEMLRCGATEIFLANIYRDKKNFRQALIYYTNALSTFKRYPLEAQMHLADLYSNMGVLYRLRKQYDQAQNFNEKAMAIRTTCLPPTHPDIASSHRTLAEVHVELNEFNKALEHGDASMLIENTPNTILDQYRCHVTPLRKDLILKF